MLKMDLEYMHNILFVRFKGILNKRFVSKISNYLNPVIKKHQIKNVVLNLEHLVDIDESGKIAILNTKSTVKNNKGNIYIVNGSKLVESKLKSLRIKKISSEDEILLLK